MKTILSFLIMAFGSTFCLGGTPRSSAEEMPSVITSLGEWQNVISNVATVTLEPPRIPSRWHIDNISEAETVQAALSTNRTFGLLLARCLEQADEEVQTKPADKALFDSSLRLCDFSDWISKRPAYGNLLLSQRALDIASIGVARLSINLDFPIDQIEQLASRMSPMWVNPDFVGKALDDDMGETVFGEAKTVDELTRIFNTGRSLLRDKTLGEKWKHEKASLGLVSSLRTVNFPATNLAFFVDAEVPIATPQTLVCTWETKQHAYLALGLRTQNMLDAHALLRFRKVVGSFPEKIVHTDAEDKEYALLKEFYSKKGMKISRDGDEGRESYDAFARLWRLRELPNPEENNLFAVAWAAYRKIRLYKIVGENAYSLHSKEKLEASDD